MPEAACTRRSVVDPLPDSLFVTVRSKLGFPILFGQIGKTNIGINRYEGRQPGTSWRIS